MIESGREGAGTDMCSFCSSASIGQDECLKLWKVFEKKPEMVSRSERKGEFTRESIR